MPTRSCLAVVLAACAASASTASAQGQELSVEGVWSNRLNSEDHPAWRIEDHLCGNCAPAELDHLKALLADPRNSDRSLADLRQEAAQVGNRYLQQLFTDAGRDRQRQFEPPADASLECRPPFIHQLIMNPLPMAIEIHEEQVVFRHHIWNTVRTVPIADRPARAEGEGSLYGVATARFEGATLIVESVNIASIATGGVNTTDDTTVVERYTPSQNGSRLDIEVTLDDPETYREPRVWITARVRTPDVELFEYDPCEGLTE